MHSVIFLTITSEKTIPRMGEKWQYILSQEIKAKKEHVAKNQ